MRVLLLPVIALSLIGLLRAQTPPAPSDSRKLWNDTYAERQNEVFAPNAFLAKVIEGRTPGTALDVGMGQGRNAIMLAEHGWDVTGYDISDVAISQARAEAQKRGVKINAVFLAPGAPFDKGVERWDMFVCIYVGCDANDVVFQSLKPGGLFVLEHLHRDSMPGGFQTNQLLEKADRRFTILLYEDAIGRPDLTWVVPPKAYRFVRLVARKEISK